MCTRRTSSRPPGAAAPPADEPPYMVFIKKHLKIIIAVAATVVVLVGGAAAAYFGGAFNNVITGGPDQPTVTTTVAAAVTTTTTKADDKEATTTVAATTTAATTTRAANTTDGNGTKTSIFQRKQNPAATSLFRELNIETYVSDDPTAKGAVEETLINFSNAVFGSARNATAEDSPYGGDVFGMEFSIDMNLSDAYVKMLAEMMFGPYEEDMYLDVIRLIGASSINTKIEVGGDVVNDNLNIEMAIDAEWNIKGRSFLSLFSYFDLNEIMFSVPALSSKLFCMESTLLPIPMGDFDSFQSQMTQLEGIGDYIDPLMPYIEKMIIAAIDELDVRDGGQETINLAGASVSVDTIDVIVNEESLIKAGIAALTTLKNDPKAQELILELYNDVIAELAEMPPFDGPMFSVALDGMIAQMEDTLDYIYYDESIRTRLYMYDGMLAGLALALPSEADVYGFVSVPGYGYAFWYDNMYYSDYEEYENQLPSHASFGQGERFEVHGLLNSTPTGYTGDLRLHLRDGDHSFDEKIMSFSNLGVKALFGAPVPTGSFTVNMNELYNAFAGNELSMISFVSQMAYNMQDLDDIPMIKNMEFTLDLEATSNEYLARITARDASMNSSIAMMFKCYFINKAISPPRGDRMNVDDFDADSGEVMALMLEVNANLNAKIDELVSMGYDVEWLKPLLSGALMGGAGDMYGDFGDSWDDHWGDLSSDEYDLLMFLMEFDGFLFPDSDKEIIDAEILSAMNAELLNIARNEIFARHGWVFNNPDLQLYFNQKSWYVPLYNNDSIRLNEIEEMNIDMIMIFESVYY